MPTSRNNANKNAGSEPKLLSGGNPQMPKGEDDGQVQADRRDARVEVLAGRAGR
jgi:hypothetical protein